jgi:hypothetical protein
MSYIILHLEQEPLSSLGSFFGCLKLAIGCGLKPPAVAVGGLALAWPKSLPEDYCCGTCFALGGYNFWFEWFTAYDSCALINTKEFYF